MLAYRQCQVVMLCERYALGALFLTLRLVPSPVFTPAREASIHRRRPYLQANDEVSGIGTTTEKSGVSHRFDLRPPKRLVAGGAMCGACEFVVPALAIGGHQLLAQTDARGPAGQVVGDPPGRPARGGVGGEAA